MPAVSYRRKKSGGNGPVAKGRRRDEEKKHRITKWVRSMRQRVAKREGRR